MQTTVHQWSAIPNPKGYVDGAIGFYDINDTLADDQYFRVRKAMITVGHEVHPYLDGDSPGARWLGTPGASPSAGYIPLT